jgi:hypothetical protein
MDSVATDKLGNCYVAGVFGWNAGFTAQFGAATLTNRGIQDAFLNKYDPAGNLLWSRQDGGSDFDQILCVRVDASGNALIAGGFSATVDFGNTNLTADGRDIFLAKISSDGDCIWVVKAGGESLDYAESVCIDGEGNCYVAGFIQSTNATFGPFTLSVRPTTFSDCQLWRNTTHQQK